MVFWSTLIVILQNVPLPGARVTEYAGGKRVSMQTIHKWKQLFPLPKSTYASHSQPNPIGTGGWRINQIQGHLWRMTTQSPWKSEKRSNLWISLRPVCLTQPCVLFPLRMEQLLPGKKDPHQNPLYLTGRGILIRQRLCTQPRCPEETVQAASPATNASFVGSVLLTASIFLKHHPKA